MTPDPATSSDLAERLRAAAAAADHDPPPGITARATRDHLVDVSVATTDSPVGPLLLARTSRGVARIAYLGRTAETAVLRRLTRDVGPRVLNDPDRLAPVIAQLDEYFAGRRDRFDLPLDLSRLPPFTRAVLDAAAAIPSGEVRSYRDVAAEAGSPRGARAAGNALGSNPVPIVVPCHRVVRTGGGLGGYTGGVDIKRRLLSLEGAPVANG